MKKEWLKKEFKNGYVFRRLDAKWLLKQGFETYESTATGFSLLAKKINTNVIVCMDSRFDKIMYKHKLCN
ncbi:MAG: hypothetical protein PF436_03190 [Prolixibacteraceae bacterium]|jgi:hypothetical protein|nr:hypothetical protein [Prolixibacteraceae bacterium]